MTSSDPTTLPDAPRAGGETPIDLDATLAALKWAVSQSWINGGCKPPAPACSVMTGPEIVADYSATLATLRSALPSLLARQRDGEREITARDVERWLDAHGFYGVERGYGGAVTLYDYDAEPGIVFMQDDLAKACALADRFMAEVPGPDDVGDEDSAKAADAWLRANDPENTSLTEDPLSASPSAERASE